MNPDEVVAVCCANDGAHLVVGLLADLGFTDDSQLWHDHSGAGGDIVCAGPFTLTYLPQRVSTR